MPDRAGVGGEVAWEAPPTCGQSICAKCAPIDQRRTGPFYIETAGTNCFIGGERCKVQSVQRSDPRHLIVTSWERPAVFYVEIGTPYGSRGQHADAIGYREIATRDEFDEITGLAQVRRDMGWPDA